MGRQGQEGIHDTTSGFLTKGDWAQLFLALLQKGITGKMANRPKLQIVRPLVFRPNAPAGWLAPTLVFPVPKPSRESDHPGPAPPSKRIKQNARRAPRHDTSLGICSAFFLTSQLQRPCHTVSPLARSTSRMLELDSVALSSTRRR